MDLKKPTIEDYNRRIPTECQYKLDKPLDFENGNADLHLVTIAENLLNWEEVAPYLELSAIMISNIKAKYPFELSLQR